MNKGRNKSLWLVLFVILCFWMALPVFQQLILAFKEYTPAMGMFGSPWVGTKNFEIATASPHFARIAANSVKLWLISTTCAGLLGLVISLLASIGKSVKNAAAAAAAALGLTFVSSDLVVGFIVKNFSQQLIDPSVYPVFFTLAVVLPLAGICGFVGSIGVWYAIKNGKDAIKSAVIGCLAGVLLLGFGSFAPSAETTQLLYNPMVYEAADTLGSYTYRTGLMQSQFSAASASMLLQGLISLIPAVVCAVLLGLLMKKEKSIVPNISGDEGSISAGSPVTGLVLSAVFVIGYLAMSLSFGWSNAGNMLNVMLPSVVWYVLFALLGAAIGFAAGLIIRKAVRTFGAGALAVIGLLMVTFASGQSSLYIMMRSMGLINTFIVTPLASLNSITPILVMMAVALVPDVRNDMNLGVIGALAVARQALLSVQPNLMVSSRRDMMNPAALMNTAINGGADINPLPFICALLAVIFALAAGYILYTTLVNEKKI
ncbi:MAG: hypothetical protein IJB92_07515 [Clostridia bacterium]|nr:hypothetical protein [Clostridia bacterium]